MVGTVGGSTQGTASDWTTVHNDFISLQQQSADLGNQIQSLEHNLQQTDTLTAATVTAEIAQLKGAKAQFDQQLGSLAHILSTLDSSSPQLTAVRADIVQNTDLPRQIASNPWLNDCALVTVIKYLQEFMRQEAFGAAMEARNVAKLETATLELGQDEQSLDRQMGQNALISGIVQGVTEGVGALAQGGALLKRAHSQGKDPKGIEDSTKTVTQAKNANKDEITRLKKEDTVNENIKQGMNPQDADDAVNGVMGGMGENRPPATQAEKDAAKQSIESNKVKIAELERKNQSLDADLASQKSRARIDENQAYSDTARMISQGVGSVGAGIKGYLDFLNKILEGDLAIVHSGQSVAGTGTSAAQKEQNAFDDGVSKGADMISNMSSSHAQAFKMGNA